MSLLVALSIFRVSIGAALLLLALAVGISLVLITKKRAHAPDLEEVSTSFDFEFYQILKSPILDDEGCFHHWFASVTFDWNGVESNSIQLSDRPEKG
jgi:hypothetical protein